MKILKAEDLTIKLDEELRKEYPDEVFIPGEIQGIIQGLIDSVHWSALRQAQEEVHANLDKEYFVSIESLETTDHFANKWMEREEIVQSIVQISGLNESMSNLALSVIERTVDNEVSEDIPVSFELIGQIQTQKLPSYTILLASTLSINCKSSGRPLSARKNKMTMSSEARR